MFNRIIFNKGKITNIIKRAKGINIFIKSKLKLTNKQLGISISCDGVCLTLISYKKGISEFYLSNETIRKSKFKKSNVGDYVNLELPLKYGQNISGHICQGHVDTVSKVTNLTNVDKSTIYEFSIDKKFYKFLVEKASILINGVSLTIAKIKKNKFEIWVIPHTLKLTNLASIKKNDLVLIDSAAECDGYASDITRTFPVDGKFTKEQSEIYDLVLSAQEKAISFIKPGITWDELHNLTVKIISEGLIKLGIIKDSFENVIKNEMYKDFYMHKTGHWLGLDVHDVGEYENIKFLPGMVITVEPGIYIDQSNINVEKKWRGIGVRIEDDVLVTNNGSEVLTKKLPKNRNDVEKICKNNG